MLQTCVCNASLRFSCPRISSQPCNGRLWLKFLSVFWKSGTFHLLMLFCIHTKKCLFKIVYPRILRKIALISAKIWRSSTVFSIDSNKISFLILAYLNDFWRIIWCWILEQWCWKMSFVITHQLPLKYILMQKTVSLNCNIFHNIQFYCI